MAKIPKREPREGEGKPLTYKTVEALDKAIELYFETDAYLGNGDSKFFAPTMSGLAYALGIDRRTLHNYTHIDEYLPSIKKAKSRVETALEQRLYAGNPAGVIFNLKNNYGWADKQEIDHGIQKDNPITELLKQISGNTLEPK